MKVCEPPREPSQIWDLVRSHASALKQRTRSRLAPGIAHRACLQVSPQRTIMRAPGQAPRGTRRILTHFLVEICSVLMAKNLFALSLDLVNEECCE